MIVLICGSRSIPAEILDDTAAAIEDDLERFQAKPIVLHGAASGVDTLAGQIAARLGLHVLSMPALWNIYGPKAGPIRNRAMLSLRPDVVFAYYTRASSHGTAHMVGIAEDAGVPVYRRELWLPRAKSA